MKKGVSDEKMTWPVAQDGKGTTLKAYAGSAFPTFCLIDRKGVLRMNDLEDVDETERAVAWLIKQK